MESRQLFPFTTFTQKKENDVIFSFPHIGFVLMFPKALDVVPILYLNMEIDSFFSFLHIGFVFMFPKAFDTVPIMYLSL